MRSFHALRSTRDSSCKRARAWGELVTPHVGRGRDDFSQWLSMLISLQLTIAYHGFSFTVAASLDTGLAGFVPLWESWGFSGLLRWFSGVNSSVSVLCSVCAQCVTVNVESCGSARGRCFCLCLWVLVFVCVCALVSEVPIWWKFWPVKVSTSEKFWLETVLSYKSFDWWQLCSEGFDWGKVVTGNCSEW